MTNRMLMVTMVRPMAIKGETSAIVFDRSVRFSSTSCMSRILLPKIFWPKIIWPKTAATHQKPKRLPRCVRCCQRLRQPAVEHHRDPVGDLGKLVEVLAGDQHGRAGSREVEQGLANDGRGTRVDTPGRLTDHED